MLAWVNNLRGSGGVVQWLALLTAMLVLYGVVGPIAASRFGWMGAAASLAAAGLCLAGASVALAAARRFRGPDQVLQGVLLGMLARMGIPLGGGIAIQLRGGPLAESGFLVYLVLFYLVALASETVLSLPTSPVAARVFQK